MENSETNKKYGNLLIDANNDGEYSICIPIEPMPPMTKRELKKWNKQADKERKYYERLHRKEAKKKKKN